MRYVGLLIAALTLPITVIAGSHEKPVRITSTLMEQDVMHDGEAVIIKRNQNSTNTIASDYALTSRPCPPFCIQPMDLAPGVETIGELELLAMMEKMNFGELDGLLIDSRTPDWAEKGMIPGAINLPWTTLSVKKSDMFTISDIFETTFGAIPLDGMWDYSNAKTLILYCNGAWCGQSPTNIRTLLTLGYPAHKIKWYRGGMQSWQGFGLTVVKP
jgi:rhodanese-related sulfurtransferase